MAGLDAVFLQQMANGITLVSLFYSGSVGIGELVIMGGYQVADGPSTL